MPSPYANRTLSARHTALDWLERGCVVMDTETTGLGPHDVAIDIAVLAIDGTVLFESLVHPPLGMRVSDSAWLVHGISDAMLRDAPAFPDVYNQLSASLFMKHIITFNADFDMRIMGQTCNAWNAPNVMRQWHCAMLLAQDYFSVKKWPTLSDAASRLDVKASAAHRARVDADTTRQIVLKIAGVL